MRLVSLDEACALLDEFGLPWANPKFDKADEPAPPFICLVGGYTEAMHADNVQWIRYMLYDVALYTSARDYELERELEAAIESHGIGVYKSTTPIDGEHLIETVYQIPIIED